MKKIIRSVFLYGAGVIFTLALFAPAAVGGSERCVNKKLIAHLEIAPLEAEEDPALEIIGLMYRHLANGVTRPVETLLADDVVWKIEGVSGVVSFAVTYEGKEGVLDYLEDLGDSVCIESLNARFYVKQGSAIHVHLIEEGVVFATGKRFARGEDSS